MNECQIKKGDSIWPEENDISGDNIFSLDENHLIKQIRAVKRKEKRDLFLEKLEEPEETEIIIEEPMPSPGKKFVKYQDLGKKDKVAYIIDQLEKYKKNDL
jgi:hypothetical protein